jgi:excisionase family DNA binding protein
MPDQLLSLYFAAERFRLSRAWLKEAADSGSVPCLRVGRRYLFNLAALERALSDLAAQSHVVERSPKGGCDDVAR